MSIQGESYLLILNSQGSNVLDNTNRNGVLYDVNWSTFLPKKYKKFHCQFVFKSQTYINATASVDQLTNNGFLNLNCGRKNIYDGSQMSNNIGIICPVVLNPYNSFYSSTNSDNNEFWMDYPTSNQITVNLNTFSGTAMANMPHYCIYLSLVGIPEEQIDKSN